MLALQLRDFVIVDALELEFGPGFTVLSGETGAGKSILLDALALVTGARADPAVVREGCARADIAAQFRTDAQLDAWLAERELAGDPGVVLLRRVIDADGRSRALVNGQPATAALLREIGERLVDIHGQHAAQSLLRADGQRLLLDAFGGLESDAKTVAQAYAQWRSLARELDESERHGRELALERERLQWQVDELAQLKLEPGEWASLEAEQKRLAHAAALIEAAVGTAGAITDDDDAIASRLHQMLQRLRPLTQIDERLAPAVELLESAAIQAEEAGSQLSAYGARLDLDPQRLAEVEQRISAVFASARKLRLAPEAIPEELEQMQARLAQLDAAQDTDGLRRRLAALAGAYDEAARKLSKARAAAGERLSAGVTALIGELGMTGGRLEVALERSDPSASGIDRVEFRVSGHAGASPRPLVKVASGGELSRIGLAISVLAAQANPVPTLIFDEADAGIGGGVAEVVGRLMRKLGEARQVLCVTHLPQVAAKAHQQFAVRKREVDGRALTRVERLGRAERVEEIARMLGGLEITATTRKHARELLAQS